MKLRYGDLTQEQRKFICNGCGGKGGFIKPPDFIFLASCNQHDFYYWRGCTKEDFKLANKEFYEMTREDIAQIKWYKIHKKAWYHAWAFLYFLAVSLGGKKYFYFGPKPKDIEDLKKEMENEKS